MLAHMTRRDLARIARERAEAREVKYHGVDGRPLDTSPARPAAAMSPWVMRALAGTLPAKDLGR